MLMDSFEMLPMTALRVIQGVLHDQIPGVTVILAIRDIF